MANKGVTQEQVNRAADALVAAGERPTVERIRAFLGSGSPNTVTRLLDGWWKELGSRLATQQAKLALPNAPEAVVVLASQWWEQAVQAAQAHAAAELEGERSALENERAALAAERQKQETERAALRLATAEAQQALALAEARLAEIQQRTEHQAEQIRDLAQQRDALQARIERQDSDLLALGERLQQQETAAAAEREAASQHVRSAEDRAHTEVDRARQEAKDLRTQLTALARERTASEQQLRQQRDEAVATTVAAQREASLQRGRADALEQQLARLGDLPATLQATLVRGASGRRGGRSATPPSGKRAAKRKPPG